MLVFRIKDAKFVVGDNVYFVDAIGNFPNATKTRYYYDEDGLQKDEGEVGDIQYDELYIVSYDIFDDYDYDEGEEIAVDKAPSKLLDAIYNYAIDNAYYYN